MSHPIPRRRPTPVAAAGGGGAGGSTTTLGSFLLSHAVKKPAAAGGAPSAPHTHTRIPAEGVMGGSYCFPDEDYEKFMRLYHKYVILEENTEHLTERQLTNGKSPLVVDLDLHFPLEMTQRVFTEEDVQNMVYEFLAVLKDKVFQLGEDDEFYVFVMLKKKPNPVPEKNMTKDGIHLLFGVQMDQAAQTLFRQKMIPVLEESWGSIGMTNSWSDAYDLSITSGNTNWQLYGSCKPKHKAYRLTQVFRVTVDPADGEPMVASEPPYDFIHNFDKFLHLSVRSNKHVALFFRDSFLSQVTAAQSSRSSRGAPGQQQQLVAGAAVTQQPGSVNGAMIAHMTTDFARIRNKEALDDALQNFLHNLLATEYHLQEAYEYTMILPATYYDDRNKWIRVGWALKNVSVSMLIVWIAFSSKSTTKFNYSDIPNLCEQWRTFSSNDLGRLTERSIIYWATNDNPEQAAIVAKNTVGHFIDMTLNSMLLSSPSGNTTARKATTKGGSDFDIANILLQMFKGVFVCVDIGKMTWYRFESHRWREIDTGDELRLGMSTDLRYMFEKRVHELHNYMSTMEPEDARYKSSQSRMDVAFKIIDRLKTNADKRNILKECADLFKDRNFLNRLDNTPKLLGCANGVIDFNTNSFRSGLPEDYITKSTQINYVPLAHAKHAAIIPEIEDFMAKIFPVDDLREYMWDHLASTIVGEPSINQTIHFYIGKGSNGKSILTELMKQTLGVDTGSYFIEANVGLITRPRGAPGQASPEIICLKGSRYAVMQEPGQNDVIYEGPMKQLVSGVESLTGRNLFKNEEVFKPQFSLVVCCNEFPAIKTRDKGTWRRVRVVDFLSQFSDNPSPTEEEPYHFLADVTLMERFPVWRETFLAMLVDRAFKTHGRVAPCRTVNEATQRYRQREDHLSNFIEDRIVKQVGRQINKSQLNEDFKLWFQNNGDGKLPKLRNLHELMDTRFGKMRNNYWQDCKISEFDAVDPESDEMMHDLNLATEYEEM